MKRRLLPEPREFLSSTWFEAPGYWRTIGRLTIFWEDRDPAARRWRDHLRCLLYGHSVERNSPDAERYWWCPSCGRVWEKQDRPRRRR